MSDVQDYGACTFLFPMLNASLANKYPEVQTVKTPQ